MIMKYQNYMERIKSKLSRIGDFIHDRLIYFGLRSEGFMQKVLLQVMLHGRKLVGFYGECHMYVYGGYLANIESVKKRYCLLGTKEIEYLVHWHGKEILQKSSWAKLDVLIYNPIPEQCKKIEVTNAAFKGYMPQHTERIYKNGGFFVWGDKYLNELLEKDDISEDDYEVLESVDYLSADEVNAYFEKSIKRMKMYERQCTVKIADYIECNGKDRILYYSVTHPETEVMIELTNRILAELGIEGADISTKIDVSDGMYDLHSHGEAVYPFVLNGLGIKNVTERKIQYGNYKYIQLAFKDYLKEYVRLGKNC